MEFINPQKVAEDYFNLQPGMKVADFGAGSGHYSMAAAKLVGVSGIVYAVDIQRELLERIKKYGEEEGLDNIEIVWADLEKPQGSTLADGSVDFVILSNIFFQIENKEGLTLEVFRVLKGGGRAAVIDWKDSFGGLGPKSEDLFRSEDCKKIFLENGFLLEGEFDPGAHHYLYIFKKP